MLCIILCKGHPCTGKSTVAAHLARILRWTICDKDDAKDQLHSLVHHKAALTDTQANAVSYDIMFAVAATQLQCGNCVIIDSPCARRHVFDCACRLAHQYHAHILLLDIHTSNPNIWRTRLQLRVEQQTHPTQQHKPQSWEALQALIQAYGDAPTWSTSLGTAWSTLENTTTCDNDIPCVDAVNETREMVVTCKKDIDVGVQRVVIDTSLGDVCGWVAPVLRVLEQWGVRRGGN